MWFHNRVPLGPDIPGIMLLFDVLYSWHVLYIQSAAAAAAAACCSVAIPMLLQQLLLFVIVCRMEKNCCGFIESDAIQCFLSHSITIYFQCMYPVAVLLSHLRPRFAHTTSSVMTDMRGPKMGVIPPRRSPPCRYTYVIT